MLVTGLFVAPVIFDTIVTAIVLVQAVRLRSFETQEGLVYIFIKDGMIYFVVATIFNTRETVF